jgi:putative hydroxymethylpyrimidine transport system substrate-binding protein
MELTLMTARRSAAACLAALLAVGLAACGEKKDSTAAPAQRGMSLMLDYLPNPDHVGIYTANESGEFAKAGLRVKIVTPPDPSAPLKLLAAGRADLAISYEPELLLAREKGADLLSVAAIATRPLTSLMSVRDKPVSPKSLAGKTVGTAGIPYQDAYLDTILDGAGVDPSTVKKVDVGFNLVPAMLSGRVDATLGAFWNVEGVQLKREKRRPRILPVDQVGVPTYDELVLVARRETVKSDGAMIRRFIQALSRGTTAARHDPQAGTAALLKAAPDLGRGFAAASVRATLPVLFPAEAGKPFGWQDKSQWQSYIDWMVNAGQLDKPMAAGAVLTNEFLPGEGVGQADSAP